MVALSPPEGCGDEAAWSGFAVLPNAVISKPVETAPELESRRSAPVSRSLSSGLESGAAPEEVPAAGGTAKPKLARTDAGNGRR